MFPETSSEDPSATSYSQMKSDTSNNNAPELPNQFSSEEILQIRLLLQLRQQASGPVGGIESSESADSEYDEFPETTHAWAIFADDPRRNNATKFDRAVGCLIIVFQLFTYGLFVKESIADYQQGQVPVTTGHAACLVSNLHPGSVAANADDDVFDEEGVFECEAGFTNDWDAIVAFFMLGIFLSADFIQAGRAIRGAPTCAGLGFALLAGFEVTWAFVAASVAISYNLYIGEVTDAIEVGVGLLFVRELSSRAYQGIRQKRNKSQWKQTNGEYKVKQYKTFFSVLIVLVTIGSFMDPLCEFLFAKQH